ncbi:hypothetical protein CRG98_038050 [Punica granatum]|uniref:Uncharacterized protein n=1 Tax=Punica granatum TaxID=22663 RepID=A0A2I0IC13_PUNGR|nr:hypothetical protein CRG98_038050 [Punica granatum]
MVPEAAALPKVFKPFFFALLGLALFYIVGHIFTRVSFSKVAISFSKVVVSFTHITKSAEKSHTPAVLRLRPGGGCYKFFASPQPIFDGFFLFSISTPFTFYFIVVEKVLSRRS